MNLIDNYLESEISKYMRSLVLIIVLNSVMLSQTLSNNGMLTLNALTSNDIPNVWSSYESHLSYIPTLSIKKDLSGFGLIDGEWAYYLKRDYAGDSLYNKIEKTHRLLPSLFFRDRLIRRLK